MSDKTDALFAKMTARVIKLIEEADETGWEKPWTSVLGDLGMPVNASTKKHYQGFNVLAFWIEAMDKGYETGFWATYKQWAALGAQVRKGEKGTQGVKWVVFYTCSTCKTKGPKACATHPQQSRRVVFPSVFTVFNAAQVDGWEPPVVEPLDEVEVVAEVEALVAASGANVTEVRGDRAYYTPGTNDIVVPLRETFKSTEGFYATVLHELVHWTGDESRLGREQKNPFGSALYAAEELVAELGSVFLQARMGLRSEPSMNAATYLKGWLSVLKADEKHLYTAARLAEKAASFLLDKVEAGEAVAA